MKSEKKSANILNNLCPPSNVSQVRKSVLQVPPDILNSLDRADHVAGGDQTERKVLKVQWDLLENPEKQDLLVPQDREEKREIGESLGQKACRDHLESLENRYLLHK